MNFICETCDTKNRLNLCHGRDGDFRFCYRPVGSISNISDIIIQPFDNIADVNTIFDEHIEDKTSVTTVPYGEHMDLMMAEVISRYKDGRTLKHNVPIGYITK